MLPERVTGAVTEIKSCLADKSTSKTLFERLRGLEVVKLGILVAKAVFIWAVVLYALKSIPMVDPDKVMGAETEMFDCLAASNVVRAVVVV